MTKSVKIYCLFKLFIPLILWTYKTAYISFFFLNIDAIKKAIKGISNKK